MSGETNACGLNCQLCPARARCGARSNFCRLGACADCATNQLMRMDVRRSIIDHLGGLDLTWPHSVDHPALPNLPDHLPVLVQAYADEVDLPWVALHGGRVFGAAGRWITPKHRRPLRDVYRLGPKTKLALELYVEDRVLEGIWAARRDLLSQLPAMGFDLVLTPNFSVWRDHSRSSNWSSSARRSRSITSWSPRECPLCRTSAGVCSSPTEGCGRSGSTLSQGLAPFRSSAAGERSMPSYARCERRSRTSRSSIGQCGPTSPSSSGASTRSTGWLSFGLPRLAAAWSSATGWRMRWRSAAASSSPAGMAGSLVRPASSSC